MVRVRRPLGIEYEFPTVIVKDARRFVRVQVNGQRIAVLLSQDRSSASGGKMLAGWIERGHGASHNQFITGVPARHGAPVWKFRAADLVVYNMTASGRP